MSDPLDFQGDDTAAANEQLKARAKRLQEVEDIKWLMGHAQGRRLVARIFEFAGIRRTSFNTNGSTMALNEGKRTVGLWLEAEVLENTPDAYMKLLKEYRSE